VTELQPVTAEVDTVPQLVVGTLVPRDGECPDCGRSRVQHATFTCADLDSIRAWVEYGRLTRLQQLRGRLRRRR
jgi:hypothetical protein